MKRLLAPLLGLTALLLTGCTGMLFQPLPNHLLEPPQVGVKARDLYFRAADNVQLHAWFLPAQTPHPEGTVLFLHGNAENISTHLGSVYWLPQRGFNVFIFDYRGYGFSDGEPSLPGIHADFAAALDKVMHMEEVDADRVVVFGQSMGAATAITGLAQSPWRTKIRALVVEGAPESYRTVARELLDRSWLTWAFQWPLSFTMNDDYRPIDAIAAISPTPVLIVHSRTDEVIPFHHGEDLYAAAREPKEFWPVDHARHIAAFTNGDQRDRLVEYLRRATSPRP